MIGQTISHYRIVDKLGEGGMGIVYKAEDTKLERTVALKFLAAHLLNDEEAKERFLREAKSAAALHHPNICTVHEIDEAEDKTFLAMAFLDGETLEDRIAKGPLPVKDALDISRQVAEGLQAAHAAGVVHRDIKPANILVSPDGRITIMDFGLARLTEASKLTRPDQTVGTAAYMSPEQMQGGEVDHRTDIWALGCVLYEMVAGVRPFPGEYAQALAFEIVNQDPEPLTSVRTGVPMDLEFIVGKCLAKQQDARYRRSDDLLVDLTNLQKKLDAPPSAVRTQSLSTVGRTVPSFEGLPVESPSPSLSARRQRAVIIALSAACLGLAALAASLWIQQGEDDPGPRPVRRFSFAPSGLPHNQPGTAVISPDGKKIAYLAGEDQPSVWLRDLQYEQPRELASTAGAEMPFWSPDSRFIGFAADGQLKKMDIDVATPISLCRLPIDSLHGGAWSPDGEWVVFAVGSPSALFRVSARGGEPERVFDAGDAFTNPHFLPSETTGRFLLIDYGPSEPDRLILIGDLQTGEWTTLGPGAYPVYSASGHILYQSNRYIGGLWALPFSLNDRQPSGEAFPIADGLGYPTVSADGTLASASYDSPAQQLGWRARNGDKLGFVGESQIVIGRPWLSPDQSQVLIQGTDIGRGRGVWVHDVDRPVKVLVETGGTAASPRWTPSGDRIVASTGAGRIVSWPADGRGESTVLLESGFRDSPSSFTPDGKFLTFQRGLPGRSDLWYGEFDDQGRMEARPLVQTQFSEMSARISPDGRYFAYVSDERGERNVYVRTFPDGAEATRISPRGGTQARWAKDGSELFYVEGRTLMAAPISTTNGFSSGAPVPLFEHDFGPQASTNYDVSADGERFLVVETLNDESPEQPAVHIIENWHEEFRDRE